MQLISSHHTIIVTNNVEQEITYVERISHLDKKEYHLSQFPLIMTKQISFVHLDNLLNPMVVLCGEKSFI